jgi:hypothetical protein
MKYLIVSAGLFIAAAILYAARYVASALLVSARQSESDKKSILTHHTQSLHIWSIGAMILAIIFLLMGAGV